MLHEMTTDDTQAIKGVADALLNERVADIFYDRLFLVAPETRELFPGDLSALKLKFMNMLATLVGSVEHPEIFRSIVESLGRRHVRYGVRVEHFAAVGAALTFSVEQVLGDCFTPQIRDAWSSLYTHISGIMMR